ncbi:MAG TPA: molybdopterin dinucleotide binding domain-containing protein [Kineosporiaceae bacterium]|nr:molybdopterin dinucleotide binding domain-containing protein [Kineosporiaceae bacterium]
MPTTTRPATCPLCEATCGLLVTVEGEGPGARVTEVRGDADDPFSRGFACPKGLAIGELHHDPDRLRTPLVDGREATWEQAWQAVHERLGRVLGEHGRDAVGVYLGNPNVHTLAGSLYVPALAKALGSRHVFSASTSDQMPKQVAAVLMFGDPLSVPVPDLDRTDLLLVLGADPLSSNGSLMTAPDMPGRLRALRRRGGRLVVVDPRTSRTARVADQHLTIRPGSDALLLAALAQVLLTGGLAADPGPHVTGLEALPAALAPFTPEAVAGPTGIEAGTIRRLAADLAAAPTAAVYGRVGTTTTRFGTVTSWLVDVVNTLTGNLDSPGGVLFPLAAAGQRNSSPATRARAPRFGRYATGVRGLPEVFGELPSAAMAEEILAGNIRGMVTVAGNPALSAPDAGRLDRALAGLDVLISVDPYLNETTRHADVVLPVPTPLQRPHLDLTFSQLSVRNVIRWADPVLPAQLPQEWQTLARLAAILGGAGPDADPAVVDSLVLRTLIGQQIAAEGSALAGRDPVEVVAELGGRPGEERLVDLLLRVGPYRLTLDQVRRHPHGLDLGELRPRLPEVLRTPSGRVELAPAPILADLPRLRAVLDEPWDGLLLVGRRHLRSNNSWGHNVASLVGGSNRCTLQVHPQDAQARGLVDGGTAAISSAAGRLVVEVEVTDRIRPGAVSLPHGWGHDLDGVGLQVARKAGGVNTNVLTPPEVDPLSGTAVFNGIPVTVAPADPDR